MVMSPFPTLSTQFKKGSVTSIFSSISLSLEDVPTIKRGNFLSAFYYNFPTSRILSPIRLLISLS